jgi:hypothetical protein
MTYTYTMHSQDVNLITKLAECIGTETLIYASKEVGLGINVEKTKYMLSCHQNVGQNRNMKIANK